MPIRRLTLCDRSVIKHTFDLSLFQFAGQRYPQYANGAQGVSPRAHVAPIIVFLTFMVRAFDSNNLKFEGGQDFLAACLTLIEQFAVSYDDLVLKLESKMFELSRGNQVSAVTRQHLEAVRQHLENERKLEAQRKFQRQHQQRPIQSTDGVNRLRSPPMSGSRPRPNTDASPVVQRRRTSALPNASMSEALAAAITPSDLSFNARPERFKVQSSYNDALPAPNLKIPSEGDVPAPSAHIPEFSVMRAVEPYKTLFSSVRDRAHTLADDFDAAADKLKTMKPEDLSLVPPHVPSQDRVATIGRVALEAEGSPSEDGLMIEGPSGKRVKLDVSKLASACLFCGQVLMVLGSNPTGACFVAYQTIPLPAQPLPQTLRSKLAKFHQGSQHMDGKHMSVVVASGPYTLQSNLSFEPIKELFDYIRRTSVSVVILTGPFLDHTHPLLQPSAANGAMDPVHMLKEVFNVIQTQAKEAGVLCCVSPSMADACDGGSSFLSVYPQCRFNRDVTGEDSQYFKSLSNPYTISLNEVVISVSGEDCLKALRQVSITRACPDGMAQLSRFMMQSRSFQPHFPVAEGLCMDPSQRHQVTLPVTPDILVSPSVLNPFCKNVDE
jgi:DNA polymerase alpha subunit B